MTPELKRRERAKGSAFTGWVVIDSDSQYMKYNILGVHDEKPLGTYFGAVFFVRKFALKMARTWGPSAKVVKVVIAEDHPA